MTGSGEVYTSNYTIAGLSLSWIQHPVMYTVLDLVVAIVTLR